MLIGIQQIEMLHSQRGDLKCRLEEVNNKKNELLEKNSEISQHINEKQALAARCEESSKRLEDLQVAFDVVSKQLDVYKSETERYKVG